MAEMLTTLSYWLGIQRMAGGLLKINGEPTGDKMDIFMLPWTQDITVKLELLSICSKEIMSNL